MDIQKDTLALLKDTLWSSSLKDVELAAASEAACSVAKRVTDLEKAWVAYEAKCASKKQSPIKKLKFKDLFNALSKPENSWAVHYLSATSNSPTPEAV